MEPSVFQFGLLSPGCGAMLSVFGVSDLRDSSVIY